MLSQDLNWQVRKARRMSCENVRGPGHSAQSQSQPQSLEVKVNLSEGEGAVPNSTTIPVPLYEGPLLVELNSTRNGHSSRCDMNLNDNLNLYANSNVTRKGKRKRS